MITTLLIGEPKTGKTRSLETLPGGTVLFSFDRGGWHALDQRYDIPGAPGRKRLKKVVFPPASKPTFKSWLDTDARLRRDEILVVEYSIADAIGFNQWTGASTELFLNFANDFNELWYKKDTCLERGIWHAALDSLTTFKEAVFEFIIASNARVLSTQQDWGQAIKKIMEVIDSAKGTEFDFILTCHIQSEKDEITGRIRELPLVYGKGLPKEILTRFDDIFMAGSERGPQGMNYFWATAPEGLLMGVGTRTFDNLPRRVEPNFGKLYGERLIHGGKER